MRHSRGFQPLTLKQERLQLAGASFRDEIKSKISVQPVLLPWQDQPLPGKLSWLLRRRQEQEPQVRRRLIISFLGAIDPFTDQTP